MAISLGILTQHFQTNPDIRSPFLRQISEISVPHSQPHQRLGALLLGRLFGGTPQHAVLAFAGAERRRGAERVLNVGSNKCHESRINDYNWYDCYHYYHDNIAIRIIISNNGIIIAIIVTNLPIIRMITMITMIGMIMIIMIGMIMIIMIGMIIMILIMIMIMIHTQIVQTILVFDG